MKLANLSGEGGPHYRTIFELASGKPILTKQEVIIPVVPRDYRSITLSQKPMGGDVSRGA